MITVKNLLKSIKNKNKMILRFLDIKFDYSIIKLYFNEMF